MSQSDKAISERLAKLRSMPVDTTELDRRVLAAIPRPDTRPRRRWMRPLQAIAASFILLIGLGVVLIANSSGPVEASPALMAQMHRDIVTGRTPIMQVETMDEANRLLAGKGPGLPDLPASHVMACCMTNVKDKTVACVLLKSENGPVTLTVADAKDVKTPSTPALTRDGHTCHVQSFESLNMVMCQHGDRWVCVIGEAPPDHLMELAASVRF